MRIKNLPYEKDIEPLHWTQTRKNYIHFILSTIEEEELTERGLLNTEAGKIEYLITRLESETGAEIIGVHVIEQWLSGLALNIPFENWEILELAEACGSCPSCGITERRKEKLIENYFNFMAHQVASMINEHKFLTVIS